VFTQLFEPVRVLNQALHLALLACGVKAGWAPQNRADRGVAWADAARLLWPHTLLGCLFAAALASASLGALPWALPFLASPILAIPFCVATASPRLAAFLRARGLCATPEERAA